MKLRKFLPVCALLVLAGSTLAGCSNGNNAAPVDVSTEINIWATAAEEEVIKTVVDNYNKKQTEESAKFKYKFTPVAESDAGTTLAKDPTVKDSPALFLCADDHIENLVSKSIVAEMKGARAESIRANNSEAAVLGAENSGKIYGYPVTSDNGYFLWYDGAALQDSDVSTLEGLLAKAKTLGKKVLMDVGNGWYANSFIMSPDACGTTSLQYKKDAEGKIYYETNWDNETGVQVSEYIAKLLAPYYADGTLVDGSNEVIAAGFGDGSMIAAVSGTWMENELKKTPAGSTLKATKLPTYSNAGKTYQMASFTGSKVYCINKTRPAAEQRAAAALADLLTQKESQLIRFEKRQALPCNNEAAKDSRYTNNVTLGGAALNQQNAYACVQSKTAEARYWDIGKAIGEAYLGKTPLAEGKTWSDFLKESMDTLRQHI